MELGAHEKEYDSRMSFKSGNFEELLKTATWPMFWLPGRLYTRVLARGVALFFGPTGRIPSTPSLKLRYKR